MKLSFHGGAGTVTGSRHLLATDRSSLLVDAGLFQGLKELRLMNWAAPAFDPASVDQLILTHAHIDHAGYLPRLCRLGYTGPVHVTPGTLDLARIMLLDSAKIQEEDAEYANRKGHSKHHPALPLYTAADAERALSQMVATPYDTWRDAGPDLRFRFHNAGHILGSGHVEVRANDRTIVFSGDVGRYDMPLHPDPVDPPPADFVVIESTYGDRVHDDTSIIEQIGPPIRRCFDRRGVVLIPSFAVGRSQLVTLILRQAMEAGELPEVPIHLDSPMAVNATDVYSRHLDEDNLDPDVVADGRNQLFPNNVHFHRTVEDSKALNGLAGPRIIISASGMLTAGRVIHHLGRLLPDRRNLVLLVGYQAAGTRGRALLEGARTLKMHGRRVPVQAEFIAVHGLSAHADRDGLLRWLRGTGNPAAVFAVHGEPEAAMALASRIRRTMQVPAYAPRLGDEYDLTDLETAAAGAS